LRGEVAVRRTDHVVVLCGDVGYRASVSAETLRHVPPVGELATLHTHLIAREDALALYGFHSEQERELFLMLISVQAVGPKVALDRSLRPRLMDDFVGQETLREQLAVALEASRARGEALDHVLLAGPPGLGKTSLAQILAAELEVPFVQTAGPALERKGD